MRSILLLLITFVCIKSRATTYYVAASGSDANNGTSPSMPWQTLNKVNSFFSSLKAGDNVLFNRGDIFYGTLTVNKSGTTGSPITIGAYGTGANPTISGFTSVTTWTNLGSNIWESTNAVSSLSYTNMVVVNGVNTPMGRTPNTGTSYVYQTNSGNTITSSNLTGTPNWTGAELAMLTTTYRVSRDIITAQSGATLTYAAPSPADLFQGIPLDFHIQNDIRTLDQQNEWYYNPTTQKLDVYSTSAPTGVQIATVDALVTIKAFNYITFDGITFTGANTSIFDIKGNYITIQNCNLNFSGSWGILAHPASAANITVQSCSINHINNNGIDLGYSNPNAVITLDTVKNCGMFLGMQGTGAGINGGNGTGEGIIVSGANSLVSFNRVDSTGSSGIAFYGDNTIVQNNYVTNFVICEGESDGGGIYTWNGTGTTGTNMKVLNNIVIGSPAVGSNSYGVYLDDGSWGDEVTGNTASGSLFGIEIHNAYNVKVRNNTCYNNTDGSIYLPSNGLVSVTGHACMDSLEIKNNIFFAQTTGQYTLWLYAKVAPLLPVHLQSDSNYFARPIDNNGSSLLTNFNNTTVTNMPLTGWRTFSGADIHSATTPVNITNTNQLAFKYNATSSPVTISLPYNYIDARGVSYNGSITLQPYTSAVLIKNGALAIQPPIANAGSDQTIQLPLDSIQLTGSATSSNGSIKAYAWTKISGPANYNISNSTAALTSVTGLVQGIYQFQLTVTDSLGYTGMDTMQVTVKAANIPPTANAGQDQIITLPVNSVTLTGNGTDPDGTVVSYAWSKISGPSSGAITNPTLVTTTVTNLVQGIYLFALKVTDNQGATGSDTMQVTVNPAPNQPPVANAGSDQTITLPLNSVSLTGSGTDADGTVVSYSWTQLSGPSSGTISNPGSATTNVTGLVQGSYQFQLTVTDNAGATGTDVMVVTVNAAVNIPPVANAGPNQSITLPVSSISLTGSGTDADGTVVSYAWTQLSGPSSGTISSPSSATTTVSGLVQGNYQFQLTVTDNGGAIGTATMQVTVNAAPNIPPVANAGPNQSITLPVSSVSLTGSGTDADGTVVSYAWTQISGPSTGTISTPSTASTTVTGLVQGVYQFQLTVTDNDGAIGTSIMQVTVNAAANIPPVANAGPDQTITLPLNSVTLTGSGTDADGTVVSYTWTQLSGPSTSIINTPAAAGTVVTGLVQGVYQFQLQVTDNGGAVGTSDMQVTVNAAVNQPPVANAGSDQTITLPLNSVSLTGSGTDADGTVVSYSWTQLSGPSSGTISNPGSATTNVTGLVQGSYQFQLTVTDNAGATGTDVMVVTVNAAVNIPPVANAGPNQSITLPVSSISLTGSGTDADGTVVSYAWTQLSGPSSGTISSPSSATTTVSGLVQGNYQFQLTVTDNGGAIGTATMQVTVNAAPNIPPVANAGPNQSITLPVSSVSLTGSGTDADGTVVSYAWTQISGPSTGTISTPSTASTTVTGLVQGVYQFQLTVTDNDGAIGTSIMQVTVNAAANIPPVANAGPDQTITLPLNSVTLTGGGTDADGTVVSYSWTQLSGPSTSIINTPAAAGTVVTGLVQGVYQFQLQVTDNGGAVGTSDMQVTVNAAVNQPPVANAGSDQTITLPLNSVSLTGSGTDADGTVVSYSWTQLSGPSSGTISNPGSATTNVTGLVQGSYQFQLTVTDNAGATGTDVMVVTVNAAVNIPPVANAGPNQSITLPVSSISLTGSGTDADGTVVSYAWTQLSGPSSGTISSPSSATTTVSGLVQGNYQFQLTVTDNGGATGTAIVEVTVNTAANIAPVANAGPNQSITLPVSSVSLTGSGTDADGTVVSYAWTQISGPSTGTISTPSTASTTVTGLVQGVYQFQLTVTDNDGAIGTSIMQVTVNAAANIPPVANAGPDQTITLPLNSVTLSGSGTDADGTVVSYSWTKISGPSGYTIVSPSSPVTSITGLVKGVYSFRLKVKDNKGATGSDVVQITVNAAVNQPPVANAGSDQTITLPLNSVSLTGSGTDADGTVVSYSWTQLSGPSSGTISNPGSATTNVTGLVQGSYQFQLTVTDNAGATGTDVMVVTVNAAVNIPPVANAGPNQSITLPVSSISLTGSGTDADGTVVSYAWTQLSGPSSGTISSPSSATTTVSGLVQGNYQFQLTVTDNGGAIGTATMQVTVNAAPNIPPVANAGPNQSITLPVSSVSLTGSGTDADGTVVSYAWTQISGPSTGTISTPSTASTTVTGLVQGVYQFQLTVTDNDGAIGTSIMQVTVNAAANIPPVANAGPDQTITLPLNSVTLTGSGTDADGTVVSYSWTKISGPSGYTIVSPSSPVTSITGLVKGVYSFRLKVKDNKGATGSDVVQITVNAAVNQPPVANAGSDQTITLPLNSVSLTGSGTDADGTVVSYSWTQLSGPSSGTISNPGSATTNVTGLVQGSYQFQLTVTDNAGATGTDVMVVTVNAAVNIPPVANAGPNQSITLPVSSISLTGSGTDADGTVVSYAWTQLSGPSSGTISSPSSATTTVSGLVQGNYQFQLTVTDNGGAIGTATMQVTVNAAPNIPPVANAGPNQSITLPVSSVSLTGSGTDADGTVVSYAWTQISGPSTGTISTPSTASTTVTGLVQGVYQFQLTVTDNDGAIGTSIMQVTVNAAANIPPVANAGPDQTITLPLNSVTLTGGGTDADGTVVSYSWTKISGPSSYYIVNNTSKVTNITGLVQGVYLFVLRVTDNNGAKGRDTVQVTVTPAINIPPIANAGPDQSITLPVNTVSLSGSGTDADGSVVSYSWVELSGPSSYNIVNSSSPITDVWGLVQGVYQFELTITDNDGATGTDTIQITVNAANTAPIANAGPEQTITLPVNSVTLSGSGTDADGTITAYSWIQISGPSSAQIVSPGSPITEIDNLSGGNYSFELTVTDNMGTTGKDTVIIVVAEPRLNTSVNITNSINVYPNPVIDVTNLQITTGYQNATIGIIISDIRGRILKSYQVTSIPGTSIQQLNFSNLAKGVYAVTVYFGDIEKKTVKLLKME